MKDGAWFVIFKVQKVYLLQQSQSLGEFHPVPAQTLPAYKNQKAEPPWCPALRTRDGMLSYPRASLPFFPAKVGLHPTNPNPMWEGGSGDI